MALYDLWRTKEIKHGNVKEPFFRHLDTVGDGTGNKHATGNYSSTPTRFKIAPSAGRVMRVHNMIISMSDTAGMQAEEYGNLGSALTNGIAVAIVKNGVDVIDVTDGIPVKTNAEWGHVAFDVTRKTWGAGDEMLLAKWRFSESGSVFRLRGDVSESLDVVLNDDLSGLLSHHFYVSGYYE